MNGGKKDMNIMGLTASPRKEGNTAWAVNKILEGAKRQGAETEHRYFSDLDIKPCRGCLGCWRKDRCVVDDDMQGIYTSLERADAFILGSPVYMGQMSGQAKIFTDRLFAQINPRFSPHFKEKNAGKKLLLLFTQGNPDPGMFRIYYDYTKSMFQMLEFDVIGIRVIAGTRNGPAHEQNGLQDMLIDVGSSMAKGDAL